MSIRVNWPIIKAKAAGAPAPAVLVELTEAQRLLLLSMTVPLSWEATYRIDGYDYSDWDELDALVADLTYRLMSSMSTNQLVDTIAFSVCCGDLAPGVRDSLTVGTGDVPPAVVAAGYAADASDWAGYEAYLCDAAHAVSDAGLQKLDALEDIAEKGVKTLAGLITILGFAALLINPLVGVPVLMADALAIWAVAKDITADIVGAVRDAWPADAIICAIVNASSSKTAVAAVFEAIDANLTPAQALIVKALGWEPLLQVAFNGETADGVAVDLSPWFGSVCDCEPAPVLSPLVINGDGSYSPDYRSGNHTAQEDVLPTQYKVNDGIQMWDGGNSVSWWGAVDALAPFNSGAVGITVTPAVNSQVRFRHARTSDFGVAATFYVRSVADNSVLSSASYNTTKIVPTVVTHPFTLLAGQSYRLVYGVNNTRAMYMGGFELVPA